MVEYARNVLGWKGASSEEFERERPEGEYKYATHTPHIFILIFSASHSPLTFLLFLLSLCHAFLYFSFSFTTLSTARNVVIYMPEVSKTHMGGTMRLGARRTLFTQPGRTLSFTLAFPFIHEHPFIVFDSVYILQSLSHYTVIQFLLLTLLFTPSLSYL